MRVLVIGATGHIGTYLVPRLVNAGHEVTAISRGRRMPYAPDPAWDRVETVNIDREAADADGTFGARVADIGAEVVIDLILFHPDSVPQLIDSLADKIKLYIYCGTMWVYGPTVLCPTTELEPRQPAAPYGRQKADVEQLLTVAAREGRLPATTLHPGHIVGPGWPPVNPQGNLNVTVWEKLARGEQLLLPNLGLEMLHHVHADDVARGLQLAAEQAQLAVGESFNVLSPQSVTLRGFSMEAASWYGQTADLEYLAWEEWKKRHGEEDIDATWEHIRNSPCGSIEKARRVLGYEPSYTTYRAIRESLAWLIDNGRVDLPHLEPAREA